MGSAEDFVVATAEEIVAAVVADAERLAAFRRRWHRALYDLGWLRVTGDDWVRTGTTGLEFGALEFKNADAILRELEDLGRHRPTSRAARCAGQLGLF